MNPRPTSDGLIIDREHIAIESHRDGRSVDSHWFDGIHFLVRMSGSSSRECGPTVLVAAMRAYAVVRIGSEVELGRYEGTDELPMPALLSESLLRIDGGGVRQPSGGGIRAPRCPSAALATHGLRLKAPR